MAEKITPEILTKLLRKADAEEIKWHERIADQLKKTDYKKELRLFKRVFRDFKVKVMEEYLYVRCPYHYRELFDDKSGRMTKCKGCSAHEIRLPRAYPALLKCVFTERTWKKIEGLK